MPVEDLSGVVEVQCPVSDVGGGGTAIKSGRTAHATPEAALRRFLRDGGGWPPLPEADEFRRARIKRRWAPLIYREGGRTLAIARTFKSAKGWSVKYVYACDSAMD